MTPCKSCALVRANASGGYPTDYLVVRVKGRQGSLITHWEPLMRAGATSGRSDEQVWGVLLGELEWLHRQMNPAMLRATAPLFGLFEVKTLILALRNVAIQRLGVVRALLGHSLLERDVQSVLLASTDVASALNGLARMTAPAASLFTGLSGLYEIGKLRALEDGLMKGYLEAVVSTPLHPVLRDFFPFFIDLRNIMLVYKHLRWDSSNACPFIRGGTIGLSLLAQILTSRDSAGLTALARRLAGRLPRSVSSDAALETLLLRAITRRLARLRRDERDVTVVVSYMWRLYVQTRNLALLVHAKDVEPELLQRELIA